jgi:very-short-patch-repair endonuclease
MSKRVIDKEKVISLCEKLIVLEKRFINKSEIAKLINVPRTTILSNGIDTDVICNKFGYYRFTLKPKGSHSVKAAYIESIKEGYIKYLKKVNRSAPLYEYLDYLKLTDIEKSKYYRYELDIVSCHEKAGIRFIKNHGLDCEQAREILRNLIVSKNRYITGLELSKELKVSRSLLSINRNKIKLTELNLEYGFVRNLRSFEIKIGELITKYLPNYIIEKEKIFKNLKSPTSKRGTLKIDYYLPEIKLAIEVDGPCHWDKNYLYYSPKVVLRDKAKNKFCKKNNIKLIRINYSEKFSESHFKKILSGIPLKLSVGQPAAEPPKEEGSETIPNGSRVQVNSKHKTSL